MRGPAVVDKEAVIAAASATDARGMELPVSASTLTSSLTLETQPIALTNERAGIVLPDLYPAPARSQGTCNTGIARALKTVESIVCRNEDVLADIVWVTNWSITNLARLSPAEKATTVETSLSSGPSPFGTHRSLSAATMAIACSRFVILFR